MGTHQSAKLDRYLGKQVKITFNDDHGCIGTFTRKGWRYAVKDCQWCHRSDPALNREMSLLLFSKSLVKRIEVIE